MRPYSFSQVCRWLNHPVTSSLSISGAAVDSRLLKKGDLFFALPGSNKDGHEFLQEVALKGACSAVVNQNYRGDNYGLELIFVADVLEALQWVATQVLKSVPCKIIAVTGSVGKTTTKDFITTLLLKKFRVGFTPGNSNSQIGLPLAILNHIKGDEEVLSIEMGMTHPNQIKKLIQIAPPDIALITTTALVHACNFKNLSEIGLAKGEIFTHPKTKVGLIDKRIVNFHEICSIGNCEKLSFGLECSDAHFNLRIEGEKMILNDSMSQGILHLLSLPGLHNKHNFLAAAAVARQMGMSWEEINAEIPLLSLPERRLEQIEKHGALFVNDSYNANALSVKAALASMPSPKSGGKKIAVLGEMLELGNFSESCHREVAETALQYVDLMFCFGKECLPIKEVWKAAGKPVELFNERKELVNALRDVLGQGDVVLLKGSRSKQTWKVLEEI